MAGPRKLAPITRTSTLLQAMLIGVTPRQAVSSSAELDQWSVIEIVCHLRDFHGYVRSECELMLNEENPHLPVYDQETVATEMSYRNQRGMRYWPGFLNRAARTWRSSQT